MWVQLHGLLIDCWRADSLSRIVRALGIPMFNDDDTRRQKRLQFASVLVEIDATAPLVDEILIEIGDSKSYKAKFYPTWNVIGHVCHKGVRMNKIWVVKAPKTHASPIVKDMISPNNPI